MSASNSDDLAQKLNGTSSHSRLEDQAKISVNETSNTPAKPRISKEEYLAKHRQIFKELTGFNSWDDWQQNFFGNAPNPNADADMDRNALIHALDLTMTALDEDTFNEVQNHREIQENFNQVALNSAVTLDSLPDDEARVKYLATTCRRLLDRLNEIEVQFLSARKVMEVMSESLSEAKSDIEENVTNHLRLTTLCYALESKIRFMTKDCEKHVDKIMVLESENDVINEVLRARNERWQTDSERIKSLEEALKQLENSLAEIQQEYKEYKQARKESGTEEKPKGSQKGTVDKIAKQKFDEDKAALAKEKTAFAKEKAELIKEKAKLLKEKEALTKENQALKKRNLALQEQITHSNDDPKSIKHDNLEIQSKQIIDMMNELRSAKEALISQAESILNSKEPISAEMVERLKDSQTTKLENHPLLVELIVKFETQADPDPVEEQMEAVRREYPELLSGKLKAFYEQYEAREQYFLQAMRIAKLEVLVQTEKLEREKRRAETDVKRLEVLSEQVETSSKAEVNLMYKVAQLEAHTRGLETELEKTTQSMTQKNLNDQTLMSYLDKMTRLATSMTDRNDSLINGCDSLRENLEVLIKERKENQSNYAGICEKYTAARKLCKVLAVERDELEFTVVKLETELTRIKLEGNEKDTSGQPKKVRSKQYPHRTGKKDVKQDVEKQINQSDNKDSSEVPDEKDKAQLTDKTDNEKGQNYDGTNGEPSNKTVKPNGSDFLSALVPSSSPSISDDSASPGLGLVAGPELGRMLAEQFETQTNPADYFKRVFGFDITGMPFHQVMQKFSDEDYLHLVTDYRKCEKPECPIHGKDATFRSGWTTLMNNINGKLSSSNANGSTSSNINNATPINTKHSPSSNLPATFPISRTPPNTPPLSSATPLTTPTPSTSSSSINGKMINGKRVFGPERPPSMHLYM